MTKILVVEPYKILQRAIAASFFPEHDVQITDHVPEMSAIEQGSYDIVVIDAGALRENNTLGDLNRRLEDYQLPIIWIEESISTVIPSRDKLIVLRKPFSKNDLLAAFGQCQRKESTRALEQPAGEDEKVGSKPVFADAAVKQDSPGKKTRIIELVDVVEEGTMRARGRRLQRKRN
jgi:hypothetical protein